MDGRSQFTLVPIVITVEYLIYILKMNTRAEQQKTISH